MKEPSSLECIYCSVAINCYFISTNPEGFHGFTTLSLNDIIFKFYNFMEFHTHFPSEISDP